MTGEGLLKTKLEKNTKLTIKAWSALTIILLILQSLGAPMYRCGGLEDKPGVVSILIYLHIEEQCLNE
jgi:hypothetical protein